MPAGKKKFFIETASYLITSPRGSHRAGNGPWNGANTDVGHFQGLHKCPWR